jgi:molybdate transport system substrate-binding protein
MSRDGRWGALFALMLCFGCGETRASRVVVFAASSLRDVFTALGDRFEELHPGVEVSFQFAGSDQLRVQLEQGAPADVFASADLAQMDALVTSHRVEHPIVFARNEPAVIVSAGSSITRFERLPDARDVVLGATEVPIGRYSKVILERASARFGADFQRRVEARVVSRELNVHQVLQKVALGEVEAGIVYRTDTRASGPSISVVEIPSELNPSAYYPIATLSDAPHPDLARAWIELVTSAVGEGALTRAGFLPR